MFFSIGKLILSTIDFQLSKESGHTVIQSGISKRLDELRNLYHEVLNWLPLLNDDVRKGVPFWAKRHIQYCTLLPDIGFLIAVTLDPENMEGLYGGEDSPDGPWQLEFVNDDAAYYKDAVMLELDERHGDLPSEITSEFLIFFFSSNA